MKKSFIFFIFLIFLFFIINFSFVSAEEITCNQKDVNGDGKVDILDLIAVRGNLNKEITVKNSKFDVNNDSKIDILDLIAVRGSLNEKCSDREVAVQGACKSKSKETAEGPGGQYCTYSDYEECYDYFTKSTAIAYDFWGSEVIRETDQCKDSNVLQEAWLNCGLLTFADNVHYKEKNCNDFDGEGGWQYYCTSNQVRKKERDFGCSDGACKFIGWKNDQLVSQNGDDSYCKDRKNYGCSLCTHNQYDCDADSECATGLTCEGPTGGAADGCCSPGEIWDTANMRCVECTGGQCCDDNGQFYLPSHVCDSKISGTDQFRCWGNALDEDVMTRYKKRYCSGSSSSCDGSITWSSEYNYENCLSNKFCSGSTSWSSAGRTCKTAQCTSGQCCDTTTGVYEFEPNQKICGGTEPWKEYGCPWGNNLGNDVGWRFAYESCSGMSASCNGGVIKQQWWVNEDCANSAFCDGSGNSFWCNAIDCSSRSDCSEDGWHDTECNTGADGDIYGTYSVYSCSNPGTKQAQCVSSDSYDKKQDCGDSGWSGQPYCNMIGQVFRDYVNKGCENAGCYSRTEAKYIKSCISGCISGQCNEDSCAEECSLGEKRCSGNYKQICGNYDADVCNEWPVSTSGSGNELCQYGCANGACKSNSINCTKNSDCGTGSTKCTNNDVYQPWRTYKCNSPGTTSSSCSYTDADKKKENCTGTFGCSTGACVISNTGRINLKAGNNVFSLPRKTYTNFNTLLTNGKTNCQIIYENGHYDLAYFTPADNTDSSNYEFLTFSSVLFPGQGYYIKVKNDCYIDVEGAIILSSDLIGFDGLGSNNLYYGWNLIGAPSIASTFNAGTCQLYDNIGILKYAYNVTSCSQVSGWNGAYQDCNDIPNGISRCKCSVNLYEPGLGYWIRTKNDCNLS